MAAKKVDRTDEHKSVFGNHRGVSGTDRVSADWSNADQGMLFKLILTVTSRGGAIRFGYTRDGGAYAVGFYYGAEATTEYCRPNENLEIFLADWIDFYSALPESGGRSPAK